MKNHQGAASRAAMNTNKKDKVSVPDTAASAFESHCSSSSPFSSFSLALGTFLFLTRCTVNNMEIMRNKAIPTATKTGPQNVWPLLCKT